MYWCINVWYTYVSTKDCGLKLNTPWNVRDGVNTPTFGVKRVFPKCLKGVIQRLKMIPVKSHERLTFYEYISHIGPRHTSFWHGMAHHGTSHSLHLLGRRRGLEVVHLGLVRRHQAETASTSASALASPCGCVASTFAAASFLGATGAFLGQHDLHCRGAHSRPAPCTSERPW